MDKYVHDYSLSATELVLVAASYLRYLYRCDDIMMFSDFLKYQNQFKTFVNVLTLHNIEPVVEYEGSPTVISSRVDPQFHIHIKHGVVDKISSCANNDECAFWVRSVNRKAVQACIKGGESR